MNVQTSASTAATPTPAESSHATPQGRRQSHGIPGTKNLFPAFGGPCSLSITDAKTRYRKKRARNSEHRCLPSPWCCESTVPRSQHVRGDNARSLRSGNLQAMEAAAVRGRVVPRLRRPTRRHLSASAGEQLRPRPPDLGRTNPTSLHNALVVVLKKEKLEITVTSETRECAKRSVSAVLGGKGNVRMR